MPQLPPPPTQREREATQAWFAKRPHLELRLSPPGADQRRYYIYSGGVLKCSHAAPQGREVQALTELIAAFEQKFER